MVIQLRKGKSLQEGILAPHQRKNPKGEEMKAKKGMKTTFVDLEGSLATLQPRNWITSGVSENLIASDQGISPLIVNKRATSIALASGQLTPVSPPVERQVQRRSRLKSPAAINTPGQEAIELASNPVSPHGRKDARTHCDGLSIDESLDLQDPISTVARESQDYITMQGMLEQGAATQTLLVILAGTGGTGDLCNTWNPMEQLRRREQAQEEVFLRAATGSPLTMQLDSQGDTLSPSTTHLDPPNAPPPQVMATSRCPDERSRCFLTPDQPIRTRDQRPSKGSLPLLQPQRPKASTSGNGRDITCEPRRAPATSSSPNPSEQASKASKKQETSRRHHECDGNRSSPQESRTSSGPKPQFFSEEQQWFQGKEQQKLSLSKIRFPFTHPMEIILMSIAPQIPPILPS
ncbi:uncharacterized protein VP01_3674g1, partial [Puccinia sorghi]